jgi:branched-chain amino acid transport system ATP-binding protein
MLKIDKLTVTYGGITAVNNISLEVAEGKIVTLIGANGAGKSTTLRTIMGYNKPSSGSINYLDQEIGGINSRQIVKRGITLVPEGRRVFTKLSVLENIKIGAYLRNDFKGIQKDIEWIYSLFPILKDRSWQAAGTLSGGEQQMLAVARALMSKPKLMMMDEPSLGLAPLVVQSIFEIIKKLNQDGVTILLIEQNANLALKIADYGYVLETGHIMLEGSGQDLLNDEHVREAYLGTSKKTG